MPKLSPAQRDALAGLLDDDDSGGDPPGGEPSAPDGPATPDAPLVPELPDVPAAPAAAPASILAAGQADVARIVASGQADAGRIHAEATADTVRAATHTDGGAGAAPVVGQTADATPAPAPGGDIAPTVQHWYERRLWGGESR